MLIAIDGACKNNGKPDCVSMGCAFIKFNDSTLVVTKAEEKSTNQRGELNGLIAGFEAGIPFIKSEPFINIVTDSEYIYNAITKEWLRAWSKKGWVTANGDPVKNKDLWERVLSLLEEYDDTVCSYYHVKGHVISLGKVTASNIIKQDISCKDLYNAVKLKFYQEKNLPNKATMLIEAARVFEKINGFVPPTESFYEMLFCNTVADIAASNELSVYVN